RDCIDDVDGQVYADGQVYYRTIEPCVRYKCKDGETSVDEIECRHPDETQTDCFKLGSKIEANCITRECGDGDAGRIFYVTELSAYQCVSDKSPQQLLPYRPLCFGL
ncbi:hypothetical protein LOTGIDRAFT_177038, partial [Lottia gigantea]